MSDHGPIDPELKALRTFVSANPLGGWWWTVEGDKVRWVGVIMPRRV